MHFSRTGAMLCAAMLMAAGTGKARAVEIGGATYTMDTTITDPATWTSGNVTVNSGVTVGLNGGLTFTGNDRDLLGQGILQNNATWDHNTDRRVAARSSVQLINAGTFNINQSGDRQMSLFDSSQFINLGDFVKTSASGSGSGRVENNGLFFNDGGNMVVQDGSFFVDVVFRSSGGQFDVAGGAVLGLRDRIHTEVRGTAAGNGRFEIQSVNAVNDTVIDVQGNGAYLVGNIGLGSNTVSMEGLLRNDTSGDRLFNGGGTFLVGEAGQFIWNTTNRVDVRGNSTFRIDGLFEDQTNSTGTAVNLFTVRGSLVEVGETGHLLKSAGSGGRRIEGPVEGGFDPRFTNSGIVEVQSGQLLFNDSRVQMLDFNGSTLLRGTWHANNGNLFFHGGVQNVETIAGDATVILTGTGTNNKIGAALATIQGGFFVNDQTFTTGAGGLTLDGGTIGGTGTIAGSIGGTGTIAPGMSAGNINISGDFALQVGSTYEWELAALTSDGTGGTAGVDWDLVTQTGGVADLSNVLVDLNFIDAATDPDNGDPFWNDAHAWLIFDVAGTGSNSSDFGGVANGEFVAGTFSTFIDDQTGQVFLQFQPAAVIPEPASIAVWALMGLAAAGYVARRRRRRQSCR